MAAMAHMGLHVFNPEWQANKTGGRMFSTSFREVTLKLFGKSDTLTFTVQTCTKVADVKAALARSLLLEQDNMEFLVKQGCSTRRQRPQEEVASQVVVKGITSFKPQKHRWPHTVAVIGCGFGGQKTLMSYLRDGDTNIVAFERLPGLGGFIWNKAANSTSMLQTELGSFHVWWGQEFVKEGNGYPDVERWGLWPSKAKMLEMFQFAAEEYGVLPHIKFNCEVDDVEMKGRKHESNRAYVLSIKSAETKTPAYLPCSIVWSFPGIMTRNRIVDFPGEDSFSGIIAYGMQDACPYKKTKGQNVAILGSGAFAIENVRTCAEYEAKKVYLVTRRKTLMCPRLASWFTHQAPAPTPAWILMNIFAPMYKLADMGDPFDYPSVTANKDRTMATLNQGTRFGIGDVAFLMMYYEKLETVEGALKRITDDALVFENLDKVENIQVIIKALGMLADHKFDKIMGMTQVVGTFCDGDWRRPFCVDPKGLKAANFVTFSSGITYKDFILSHKHLFDFPSMYTKAEEQGLLQALPVNTVNMEEDKPAYAVNIGHMMSSMMMLGNFCPEFASINAIDEAYAHRMYHHSHGTKYFLDACTAEWNEFQNKWRLQGSRKEFVPYPYTSEMIRGYFASYNRSTGSSVFPTGIPQDAPPLQVPPIHASPGQKPHWISDDSALSGMEKEVNEDHKVWWISNPSTTMYDGFLRKERPHPTVFRGTLPAPGWWQAPGEASPHDVTENPSITA